MKMLRQQKTFMVLTTILGVPLCLYVFLHHKYSTLTPITETGRRTKYVQEKCVLHPYTPCQYSDDVDLRVIVMAFNRYKSLQKCLEALQEVHLDGDTAALEIWIDRKPNRDFHNETVNVAKSFIWNHGPTRVNIWSEHVGIMGNWKNTWRPKENTREVVAILEDDIDVSPYFYRWLKAAHHFYGDRKDIATVGLSNEVVNYASGKRRGRHVTGPKDVPVYLYPLLITWGNSPLPKPWREFQDWYNKTREENPKYKPYTKGADRATSWYKQFEKKGTERHHWEMWFIHFCYLKGYYNLHPNIDRITGYEGKYLAKNRKEAGLHYAAPRSPVETSQYLVSKWNKSFIDFPDSPIKYWYDGRIKN